MKNHKDGEVEVNNRNTIIDVLRKIASDKHMLNRAYWALICGEAADLLETDALILLKAQEPVKPVVDNVNHPSHYKRGGIEVIDAIEAWGFGEGFNKGNAIKYIVRAGHKDPDAEIEDLEKAKWYLEREIERLKSGSSN